MTTIKDLSAKVDYHNEQIIEIRIQLSTFNLVKTIVFTGVAMMATTVFGGMITAGIYIASQ